MKLTCFIIDDEPLAIEVIESHITKLDSVEITGTFQNAVAAFQALRNTKVDLLFLDIQMPELTGIEFLKTLKHPPKVIFTTAYREYALEGFELDAVDYLLKPISFDRFLKAVDKVMERNVSPPVLQGSSGQTDDVIFIQSGYRNFKILLPEILYLESKGDYVLFKTTDKEVTTHATLSSMDEQLPAHSFLRIHRSFIVNVAKIESWSQTEVIVDKEEVPIGRSYKNQTIRFLKKL